ncbi:hypothetical protein [Paenimyroides marinum]|nr:hypothetical protein [Paenimyroides aquimaris]
MKYKILLLALGMLSVVSCKTTAKKNSEKDSDTNDKKELVRSDKKEEIFFTEQTRNDFRAVSESAQQKFLEAYNATDKQYSILFFTQGFNGEDVIVKNDNSTLYKGSVLTNKTTGLAKNMRIVNTEVTSIYDKATKKTIYINTNKASKHKFVYVMKGNPDEEKPYKITYSDKLRPEK